jgi:lipopolysaccharide transport system permease protein
MINYLELLWQFITTDFKLRYKNSYLGIIWIMLKPLAMFSVIYLIWSNIFKLDESYKMGLLLGIIIMNFFSEAIMMGLSSLMSKAGIILKINFPREVVVYSAVSIALVDFLFNMLVFIVFTFFTPVHTTGLGLLLFALCILSVFVLTMGISLFISIMFIKLRDIHNLMEVALQLIFWMTPVYYTLAMMPANLQSIIKLNPLTLVVTYARKGLIEGSTVRVEDFYQIGLVLLGSLVVLLRGNLFFKARVLRLLNTSNMDQKPLIQLKNVKNLFFTS